MPTIMENVPPIHTCVETKPEETLLGSRALGMDMPPRFHPISTIEPMVSYSPVVQVAITAEPTISMFGRGSLLEERRRIP